MRDFTGLVAVMVLTLCACSSNREAAARSKCILISPDPMSGQPPVYMECGVDRKARLTKNAPVDYRPAIVARSPSRADICYVAEVEFVVDIEGVPERESIHLIRATDPAFGNAVLGTVSRWRYAPALKGELPVRQLVRERRAMAIRVVPLGASPGSRPYC